MEEQEQMDVGNIFRVIFCSCDTDNTDLVPVSKLIEFVQPFMIEDLNALEDLRHSLDPEGTNALVSSERFYQVMGHWSQKIGATSSNEETEFNRSPSRLTVIDDRELPYTHSTPRASLGDKLLKCKDLLNMSNVSGYSLSTSRMDTTNPSDSNKTVLEEEIKKLEHQLLKTTNELSVTKQQLTASEEQNETFQQDLDRLNRRLHAEQQVNEHLQKEKKITEDLREELSHCKKVIEEQKKKLSQSEKDSMYHRGVINELDEEKVKLEKKIAVLSKQHQDCLKEIFDLKTELETKDQQLTDVIKVYDELKTKYAEQKDFNDQLREENDLLSHQKSTLEGALKVKSITSPHSNLGNLKLDLSNTPSPSHSTHHTDSPHYSYPILTPNQNGIQPKCQSSCLLRRVLARNSSTPVSLANSLLDISIPDSVKNLPVLSPVHGAGHEARHPLHDSSEEDLYWKFQQGGDAKLKGQNLNGTTESLQTEIHRADSQTYHTDLFERDEKIIDLEEELEKIKDYLKEIEDQKNDFLTKLKEQNKINEELIETNFKLLTKEESSQTKIESLKNRLVHLERNGVIVENEHEASEGEIDDMKNKIKTFEETLLNKEKDLEVFKAKIESVVSLEREIAGLKELLKNKDSLIADYDEKLQAAMRDLGEISGDKVTVEEKLKKLNHEKQNLVDKNSLSLEETLQKVKVLEEKLSKVEYLNKDISIENEILKEEHFSFKHGLESELSKCDRHTKILTMVEEENKKIINKLEENINLKDEELKRLINTQKEKDEELELFKVNLEKKIVGEFEGKVKYSMDAEENILNLNKKCKQLEEDLKNCLSKLSSKNRILAESENKIKFLNNIENSLKQEIDSLKASKSELEQTIANLKIEQDDFTVKLEKVNQIDGVASEIQKHIKDKDIVIEELKQLNKKMEHNLKESQLDLRQKVDDILQLRNEWTKGIDIKNDLWQRIKTLERENSSIKAENRELLEKHQQLVDSSEALKIEHNNLLIIYDLEVNKNFNLNEQIAQCIEEKNEYFNKYSDLKIEFDNIVSKFEVEEQKLHLYMSEKETKLYDLETRNKELRDKLAQDQKNDSMSQTEATDTEAFEEEFSKIKVESDKLLEELESRLNEELNKNRNLTNDLLELKNHLDQSNTELFEMKQKITNNEAEMVAKLQQNIENGKKLAEELSQTKEALHIKDVEQNELNNHIKETEEKLKVLSDKNMKLEQELAYKSEELGKMERKLLGNHENIEIKNSELLKQLTAVESLLKQEQTEMEHLNYKNQQLMTELDSTKKDKDMLNNVLSDAASKNLALKEKLCEYKKEKNTLQKQRRLEIEDVESKNKLLLSELEVTKKEKEKSNNELSNSIHEIFHLKVKLSELNNEKSVLLGQKEKQISHIENINEKLKDELNVTKQEKEKLNSELQTASFEIIQLKEKLKEEIVKSKAVFDSFVQLKKERDQLVVDLDENKSALLDTKTIYNKRQMEFKDLQVRCLELETKIQTQTEQLKQSEVLLLQSKDDVIKMELEKNLINNELLKVKSSLAKVNSELKNMEIALSETKNELDIKRLDKEKLILDLEEAKRKWSESFTFDGNTNFNADKEIGKRRTYSKQQITIDKLRDKLEDLENKLKLGKNKNQELKMQLSLLENSIIRSKEEYENEISKLQGQLKAKESTKQDLKRTRSVPTLVKTLPQGCGEAGSNKIKCEGKTVNKFTLASRPASPDSPSLDIEVNGFDNCKKLSFYKKCPFSLNCDSIIEIPPLDLNGFADDIIEELGLTEGSPRKKFNREEMENNVTALTLRVLVSSKDITERIESQTEKYRCQYENILTLIRDISHRLRDHVCIGTAEPIMPVFVLLEDIKLQLKEVVRTAGQVGVFVYEDRMKKCWNLVTNYMATLRQENESLQSISRETTPTQTGLVRRRNKSTQDKSDTAEQISHRRRRLITCTRLTATLLFILAFALTTSIIIHLNCRMTASENQYCPLDGIITRINVGVPPM